MEPELKSTRRALVRDVLILQLKLLLGAARDLALTPVTLAAAALDLVLSRRQPPRYFHAVLRLGERSDHFIDTWSAGRGADAPQRENVDALLHRIEETVRDPQTGARRARVLRRWAERQVKQARQRITVDAPRPSDDAPKPD